MRLSRRRFSKGLATLALMPVAARAVAAPPMDPGLQARLLQRSDGELYVYSGFSSLLSECEAPLPLLPRVPFDAVGETVVQTVAW